MSTTRANSLTSSAVTDFLATPVGGATVVVAALVGFGLLLLWARQPGATSRGAVVLAASALGIVVAALNVALGGSGVWRSATYALPLVVLAALYLVLPSVFVALLLMGYRWLGRRTDRAAAVYAVFLLAVVAPLIVVGDTLALESGYIAFGAGYTVWGDMLLGVALFALPVLTYEGLRHRQRRRPKSAGN